MIPLLLYRNTGIYRIVVRNIKRDIGTGLHIISNSQLSLSMPAV